MLIRTLILFVVLMFPVIAIAQIDGPALTLEQALEIAAGSRLELTAAEADAEAARQKARQQSSWLNPVLYMELEGAPTDGDAWRNADRIIGIGQTLPFGGRRSADHDGARQLALAAEARRDWTALLVAASVRRAFAQVLFADGLVALQELLVLSNQTTMDIVSSRLELGGASSDELAHARLEYGAAKLDLARAQSGMVTARTQLAVAIGVEIDQLPQLDGDLGKPGNLPNLDAMLETLDVFPELRAANARAEATDAFARSASRSRIPDVDLSLGIRRFGGNINLNNAVDAGVSFQLPLFNRSGARVAAARAEAVAGQALARLTQIDLEQRLQDICNRLETAEHVVITYESDLLPAADTVLASVEQRHAAGDAELIDVLQVREKWVQRRLNNLEARLELDFIRAELAAVTNN